MINITNRMELNVLDWNSALPRVSEFAYKNRCPAIVTLPQLVPAFMADREAKKGLYRVITAVDFGGTSFAMQKLRDMGNDAAAADGYDIMLSAGRPMNETFNEIKSVTEFLRNINPLAEIRWVLGAFTRPTSDIHNYLKCFEKFPSINWIRVDQHVNSKTTPGQHFGMVESLRLGCKLPLKISGNINWEVVDHFAKDKAIRFDVTLDQANAILLGPPKQEEKKEEPKNTPQTEIEGERVTGVIGQDV